MYDSNEMENNFINVISVKHELWKMVCSEPFSIPSIQLLLIYSHTLSLSHTHTQTKWGAFYLFIADFFATQIIGGDKELVVLL